MRRQPRIDRQTRHAATDRRQTIVDDRAQFGQQRQRIANRARFRRIEERKRLDVAESERAHLQHDRRQVRAADFGIGVRGLREEVGLRVQAITDAGRDAATPSFALIRARLRHTFDRQALQFRSIAVAAEPRKTRVDHEADVRHGQRRFGDVRRKHDSPASTGCEDPLLFRHRQAARTAAGCRSDRAIRVAAVSMFRGFPVRRPGTRARRSRRTPVCARCRESRPGSAGPDRCRATSDGR